MRCDRKMSENPTDEREKRVTRRVADAERRYCRCKFAAIDEWHTRRHRLQIDDEGNNENDDRSKKRTRKNLHFIYQFPVTAGRAFEEI